MCTHVCVRAHTCGPVFLVVRRALCLSTVLSLTPQELLSSPSSHGPRPHPAPHLYSFGGALPAVTLPPPSFQEFIQQRTSPVQHLPLCSPSWPPDRSIPSEPQEPVGWDLLHGLGGDCRRGSGVSLAPPYRSTPIPTSLLSGDRPQLGLDSRLLCTVLTINPPQCLCVVDSSHAPVDGAEGSKGKGWCGRREERQRVKAGMGGPGQEHRRTPAPFSGSFSSNPFLLQKPLSGIPRGHMGTLGLCPHSLFTGSTQEVPGEPVFLTPHLQRPSHTASLPPQLCP